MYYTMFCLFNILSNAFFNIFIHGKMKTVIIPVTPVAAPRMTQSDKWKKRPCVLKYRAACDIIRLHMKELPEAFSITFYLPMPASWSDKKKREMDGKPHKQKIDLDNAVKGFCDAFQKDDSHVHTVTMSKVWACEGSIKVIYEERKQS